MQPYIDFSMRHWQLTAGLLILIFLFILNEIREHLFGTPRVTTKQLIDMMNHQDALVVDLRTAHEYEKAHILNTISIPQAELPQKMNKLENYKDKPLIFICSNGQHSASVGHRLRKTGYTQVACLLDGMRGWIQEGLPVVQAK